jgi:hypothetical protein
MILENPIKKHIDGVLVAAVPRLYTEDLMDPNNIFKNPYGSVRPYTRHSSTCRNAPEDHSCLCAKWIYIFVAKTKKKTRHSLNTPSWAEAVRLGHDILRGLDPEIAEHREVTRKREKTRCTVADACLRIWLSLPA